MSFNVFITENFKKEFKVLFKKYQSLKEDVSELTSSLETISTKELEALIKSAV